MQLDRTAIAIRERGMMDILDLALHVTRNYLPRLLLLFAVGCAPFLLLNRYALGWLMAVDPRDYAPEENFLRLLRYAWNMSLLVFLQAPLATALITTFLGRAVFLEQPGLRAVFREVRSVMGRLLWCQGVMRGALPACAVALLLPRGDGAWEWILFLLALVVAFAKSMRPFLNEIVLLEKNPLRARPGTGAMSIGRRSVSLHAGGALFVTFLGGGLIAPMLAFALFMTMLFLQGVMTNYWTMGAAMKLFLLPLSLWLTAALMSVFRFLSYLDLRIRQEGWAVELRLRAEASRLQAGLPAGAK